MRARRLKEKFRTQSKLEEKVGEILKGMFPNYPIYSQYPYYDILTKGYKWHPDSPKDSVLLKKGRRLKADFCIPDLWLVIECQGEQHYGIVSWGKSMGKTTAISRFYDQQRIDCDKRLIANEAEFTLIEIKYDETISEEIMWEKIEM